MKKYRIKTQQSNQKSNFSGKYIGHSKKTANQFPKAVNLNVLVKMQIGFICMFALNKHFLYSSWQFSCRLFRSIPLQNAKLF